MEQHKVSKLFLAAAFVLVLLISGAIYLNPSLIVGFTIQPKDVKSEKSRLQGIDTWGQTVKSTDGDTAPSKSKTIPSGHTSDGNISNWSTYTNKQYGYQIKHPANWAIEVDGIVVWQNQVPNPEIGNSIMFFGTKTEPYGQTARMLWRIVVFVSPTTNPKKLSPRDWYIEQSKLHFSYGVEQKFDNLEDTTFKGLPALKVKGNSGEGYSFLITKNSTIYHLAFSFEKFSGGEFSDQPEEIFLEMLDSFILN